MIVGVARWFLASGFALGRRWAFPLLALVVFWQSFASQSSINQLGWRPSHLVFFLLLGWTAWLGGSLWGGEVERAFRRLLCPMALAPAPWFLAALLGRLVPAFALNLVPFLLGLARGYLQELGWRLLFVFAFAGAVVAMGAFWSVLLNSSAGGLLACLQFFAGEPLWFALTAPIPPLGKSPFFAGLFTLLFPLIPHWPWNIDRASTLALVWCGSFFLWSGLGLGVAAWRRC